MKKQTKKHIRLIQNQVGQILNDPAVCDYLRSLNSPKSRQSMSYYLSGFLNCAVSDDLLFDWNKLTDRVILKFIDELLKKQQAPSSINTKLCAVKGVAKRLWTQRRIDNSTYQLICEIKNVRGSRISHGRMLSDEEVKKLFDCTDRQTALKQLRDGAIFAVMAGLGLRRSEVAGLKLGNLYLTERRPFIRVIGKGNKERQLPLPKFVLQKLNDWIEARGSFEGSLFTHILKDETVTRDGICSQRIYRICRNYTQALGMKSWSPHDLRRTCASKLIEMGVDLNTVKDYLGHSSVTVTQLYDKRGRDRLDDAAKMVKY